MRARLRRTAKRVSSSAFLTLDRAGLHVLPKHYYSPVADRTWLREHADLWRLPMPMHCVDWDLEAQLAWLRHVCEPYYREVAGLGEYGRLVANAAGPGFGPIESQVLHCFIRSHAPARVVEVGGGVTTAVMARASELNVAQGRQGSAVTTVEPYPSPALRALGVRLLAEPCQAVSREVFDELGGGDLLLIDSTHALKTGSELPRLYLEIIPSLPPGVFVHVHDIFLPYLHSPDVLVTFFDWQETALLLALLTGNDKLEVLCCESALHWERRDELRVILSDYRPAEGVERGEGVNGHFPASTWLRTR